MIFNILNIPDYFILLGVCLAFLATLFFIRKCENVLPRDAGRAFAVEGTLSKGKVRGAGIVFILCFVICDFLFNTFSIERSIYFAIIAACMITGYLDDSASTPWNEYFKGFLDLLLGVATAVTYLFYNGNTFYIGILHSKPIVLPYWLFGLLIVVLVWTAINVTNCTDGVDGLSATLTIITLLSFYVIITKVSDMWGTPYSIVLFVAVLVAYLWYNCNPSTVLMGDAGSRAMGMMIAIISLKSGSPLMYIPLSLVMALDGGLGLLKVALIRFLKIKILVNTKCPLHDHARKTYGWSNTQVVFRFAIIQIAVSLIFVWLFDMLR